MPYRNSPLNPNARKVGKRSSGSSDSKDEKGGGSGSSKQESYIASCPDCGSLGAYFNADDAKNAENLHQQRKHGNSAHKKTVTGGVHGEQNRRNKGKGGKK